jgi:rod shape-determining protein MreD
MLVFAVFFQATLIARVRFLEASPNLLLIAVVAWSLLRGVDEGILWGLIGGLLFDLITGLPLGASSLALMTICFLTGKWEGRLFQGNLFLPAIAVALATPVYGLVILASKQLAGAPVSWTAAFVSVVLPELLLNVAGVSVVYPLLRLIARHMRAARMEW